MNGNVTFVWLNFQVRVEEEHLKKEGNNGEDYWIIRARISRAYFISVGRVYYKGEVFLTDRKQILLEILQLEAKIFTLEKNPTYRKNKHYLNLLDGIRFGPSMMSIPSPDEPTIILRIKNNSQEMKNIRLKYRVNQSEYEMQMDELHSQKARLQEKLFNYTL